MFNLMCKSKATISKQCSMNHLDVSLKFKYNILLYNVEVKVNWSKDKIIFKSIVKIAMEKYQL